MFLNKLHKIIRIILILLPIFILSYLLDKEFVFSGKLVVVKNFRNNSPFISDFFPWERVGDIKRDEQRNYYQSIISEPVYFDLKLPRPFKKAKVEITYQNDNLPFFQIGAQASPYEWEYQLKPLENQYLDRIDWPKIQENGVTLFQREKKFDTIDDFLKNLPDYNKIVVYNYKLDRDFRIPNYKPGGGLEIEKTIRGRHNLYTYLENEPLDFTFLVQDINRHPGPDSLEIIVYRRDEEIYRTTLPDDGITDDSGKPSEKREVRVILTDLTPGVYKIELKAGDDIFIRKIKSKEHLLILQDRLYLTDNEEYKDSLSDIETSPSTIYTNGRRLVLETPHQKSVQTLKINNDNFKLEEAHKPFIYKVFHDQPKDILTSIYLPKNDIIIETSGLFSFSKESFFNPFITSFKENLDLNALGINYIITSYQSPKKEDNWKIAITDFDLSSLYFKNNSLRFIFSIPGIEKDKEIRLKEIKFILEREPITWKNFWPRLFNKLR